MVSVRNFHRSARAPPAARGHARASPAVTAPQVTASVHDFAGSLTDYQAHYNTARPHQGIAQRILDDEPDPPRTTVTGIDTQQIRRKPIPGSLINEYTHAA